MVGLAGMVGRLGRTRWLAYWVAGRTVPGATGVPGVLPVVPGVPDAGARRNTMTHRKNIMTVGLAGWLGWLVFLKTE